MTRIPVRPMKKWCRECLEFKDNPEDKKRPQYCPDCIEFRNNKRWNKK